MYEKIKSWGPGKILAGIIVVVVAFVIIHGFFVGRSPRIHLGQTSNTMVDQSAVAPGFGGTVGGMFSRESGKAMDTTYPYPPQVPASTEDLPNGDRKVIKNGSLDLLVKNADDAVKGISAVATKYEGFVDGSNIYEISEGIKSGSVTIRVPGGSFTAAMEDLKQLAVKVRNENSSSQDVTAQFVDLEARLKNLKAEEAQYVEIMKRATKIEDVLNVSQHLYQTRGQIEATQGQMNYLSRQVDMSSITISLTAEAEVEVFGIVWRPLTVLKQSMRSALTDLINFVNWLIVGLFKLPVLILRLAVFIIFVGIVWKLVLWANKRFFGKISRG